MPVGLLAKLAFVWFNIGMVPLNKLLHLLPGRLLERLAVQYQIDERTHVRLPGQTLFVCLLNVLINHPLSTQRLLEETYAQRTGGHADHSSFSRALARLNPAYFQAIFEHLWERMAPQASPAEKTALRVRRVDATHVTLSAKLLAFGLRSGGRNGTTRRCVKSVMELSEAGLPRLLRVCEEPAQASDDRAIGVLMATQTRTGDLWVFDKGVHGQAILLGIHQAGGYFLTPHHAQQTFQQRRIVWQADPSPPRTPPDVPKAPAFRLVRVEEVHLHPSPRQKSSFAAQIQQMPLVLLSGERWDTRTRTWKPLELLTNLPLSADQRQVGPFTFLELAQVYRLRWEIEVFFKFLKQHLSFDHLLSRCENGIRCMLYMSLCAALLLIWYKQQTDIDRGWRSVKFWLADDLLRWTQQVLQEPYAYQPSG